MRRFALLVTTLGFLLSLFASAVVAGGPPSLAFYVDGERYRTVATPTDFTNTGAPTFTYDRIYALGSGLVNVAEAKPGDPDFNGGRWAVMPITWHSAPVQLTSAEQVEAHYAAGLLSIGEEPIRLFFCSVSPVPPGKS